MRQEAIELQEDAVKDLYSKTNEIDEIVFKAPTGSGKTFMMADYMNRILSDSNDVIFIVSSLSKGNLAIQNYEKFLQYCNEGRFKQLSPYLINSESSDEEQLYVPTNYNVYVLPRDLYRSGTKLSRGSLMGFLNEITSKKHKRIYLIKDECHIKTKNLDDISEYFDKTINFSATPKLSKGQKPDVEIDEQKAIDANLIKSVKFQKYLFDNEYENLDYALDKFEEIKEKYNNEIGINPCIIVQISNKDKADEELELIKSVLSNVKHQDLKYMLIVDKNNKPDVQKCETNDIIGKKNIPVSKWIDFAKTSTSTIDVIIFKMVISEGWDIPRACMLYQIRDTKSKQLDEQVIGRVRRNPRLLDFEYLDYSQQELISTAYVWGINDNIIHTVHEVTLGKNHIAIQDELRISTTILNDLSSSSSFNIGDCIVDDNSIVPKSIFELYKNFKKSNNEVKKHFDRYVDSVPKWYSFVNSINEIAKALKLELCDYDKNMEVLNKDSLDPTVSVPTTSYYTDNGNYREIDDWIWKRSDGGTEFSFDSHAEQKWAEILLNLQNKNSRIKGRLIKSAENEDEDIYLWGKNFVGNSEIRYEYYLNGRHFSYPDFIMKDHLDRMHVFEVKSANKSKLKNIDELEYNEKVIAIRECYCAASKIVNHHFWIPVLVDKNWTLFHYYEGKEEIVSRERFIQIIKN